MKAKTGSNALCALACISTSFPTFNLLFPTHFPTAAKVLDRRDVDHSISPLILQHQLIAVLEIETRYMHRNKLKEPHLRLQTDSVIGSNTTSYNPCAPEDAQSSGVRLSHVYFIVVQIQTHKAFVPAISVLHSGTPLSLQSCAQFCLLFSGSEPIPAISAQLLVAYLALEADGLPACRGYFVGHFRPIHSWPAACRCGCCCTSWLYVSVSIDDNVYDPGYINTNTHDLQLL